MIKNNQIVALIPAYNAEQTLEAVISGLRTIRELPIQIVVINDGSFDATKCIAQKLDVDVINHSKNCGKGAALKSGFKFAIQQNSEFVLTIDADNQHNPKDVIKLFKTLHDNNLDIVIGSRMNNLKDMPIHRKISNKTTSKLLSWLIGQKIIDSQCGFRIIRTNVLRNIQLVTNHFDLESEIIIKAVKKNYRIGFCPVETIYDKNDTSHMRVVDIFRFIAVYLSNL